MTTPNGLTPQQQAIVDQMWAAREKAESTGVGTFQPGVQYDYGENREGGRFVPNPQAEERRKRSYQNRARDYRKPAIIDVPFDAPVNIDPLPEHPPGIQPPVEGGPGINPPPIPPALPSQAAPPAVQQVSYPIAVNALHQRGPVPATQIASGGRNAMMQPFRPIGLPIPAITVGGVLAGSLARYGFRRGIPIQLTPSLWGSLPGWLRAGLAGLGITVGSEIVLEMLPGEDGLIPGRQFSTAGYSVGDTVEGGQVVKTWRANGVNFVRLADGRQGAQRKDGVWKFWRPKKPIVLYSGGASNLKDFLRADNALNKQSKRLAKTLNRRAPKRRTSTRRRSNDGPGTHIHNVEVG